MVKPGKIQGVPFKTQLIQQSCTTIQKLNEKLFPSCNVTFLITQEPMSPQLLGCHCCQIWISSGGASMAHSWAKHVFILKHHFTLKLSAVIHEVFSNVYPDKEVPNKTTLHPLVTQFWDTTGNMSGIKKFWQVICSATLKKPAAFFL
jgi:hypothetical protein